MTVMVTGASGVLGRAIVRALARHDEVRAAVRRPEAADALRERGAKVTIRAGTHPDELLEVLTRVHTLVHLIGGVNQSSDEEILAANHGSTVAAVAAAKEAKVRRVILLSAAGASIDHPHPYLRAKGLAEEVVTESGLEYAVLRSTHAFGLGGLWFTSTVVGAEHGFVVGDGHQRVSPMSADDVADVVAAIDDLREPVEGTWSIAGPQELTADEVFAIVAEGGDPGHLDPVAAAARLTELLAIPVSVRATELFATASVADAPDAAAAFGITTTPFVAGLRELVAKAAETADRVPRDA